VKVRAVNSPVLIKNNQLQARRIQWLYAFQRNERWKEQVLLSAEELRRLGATQLHIASTAKRRANTASALGDTWFERGLKAMLNEIACEEESKLQGLPPPCNPGAALTP
jgi:hypothetical protein